MARGRSSWSGRTATWRRGAGPGSMHLVTGYLRDLFTEPPGEHVGERPVAMAPGR
jgi:hypothetical protein